MDLDGTVHCLLARLRVSGADNEIIGCLALRGVFLKSAVACSPSLRPSVCAMYVESVACLDAACFGG